MIKRIGNATASIDLPETFSTLESFIQWWFALPHGLTKFASVYGIDDEPAGSAVRAALDLRYPGWSRGAKGPHTSDIAGWLAVLGGKEPTVAEVYAQYYHHRADGFWVTNPAIVKRISDHYAAISEPVVASAGMGGQAAWRAIRGIADSMLGDNSAQPDTSVSATIETGDGAILDPEIRLRLVAFAFDPKDAHRTLVQRVLAKIPEVDFQARWSDRASSYPEFVRLVVEAAREEGLAEGEGTAEFYGGPYDELVRELDAAA